MATVTGQGCVPVTIGNMKAEADYSAATTFLAMVAGSADHGIVTSGAGARVIGVRLNKPASGEAVELCIGGTCLVTLGGNVSRGELMKSHSDGTGIAVAADKDYFFAQALQSGVSGDQIEAKIMFGYVSSS